MCRKNKALRIWSLSFDFSFLGVRERESVRVCVDRRGGAHTRPKGELF